MKPVIAIVGRPNVGKSTFFNRCVGGREAIVYDTPGVTRDRIYRDCQWSGYDFVLIDTGGLIPESLETLAAQVRSQVQMAIDEADVIIFLVDGKEGLNGGDYDVAKLLRQSRKPVLLAVNKIDKLTETPALMEFYQLGLGDPLALSALRGTGGVGDLLDAVVSHFPETAVRQKRRLKQAGSKLARKAALLEPEELDATDEALSNDFSIAIIGKPNVGKSSLVNAICGRERSIVTDIPGTTRDALDTQIDCQDSRITLIDTAGIRRKARVDYGVEAFSVVRSIKAISRADVVVLVLDASQPISDQDQKIAAKIEEAGKPALVVFNKWDLIENKSSRLMNEFKEEVFRELPHIRYAEVVFTSAVNKQRVDKIIERSKAVLAESRRRISTAVLNQVINEAQLLTPPPAGSRGKRLRIYYSTQVAVSPPTMALFVNDVKLLSSQYRAYLDRKLRESFGFIGTPLRLVLRPKDKK